MTKEELIKLKEDIAHLSPDELKIRDLYLRELASGEMQGPPVGYASIDKPWLKYYEKQVLMSDIPQKTAYRYIYDNNIKNLDKNAFDFFGRKIKYKDFFENIDIVSNVLTNYGVKKGDIVSIAMPSFPETFYLFYAISKIGAIANMIDPRTSSDGIKGYVKETHSSLLFVLDSIEDKTNNIKADTAIRDIVTISPANSLPSVLSYLYKLKAKKQSENLNWKNFLEKYYQKNQPKNVELPYEKDRPLVIVHTGGTTGISKGVILTDDNINSASYQCETAGYDFQSKHNWLNIMPPFIAYGVGNGLHLPLACGMEVILIPSFDPSKFDKLLLKYKPNHMVGVPSHYGHLMESKKLRNKDLSFIIAPTVGGDKMDEELEKKLNLYFQEHNCDYKIVKGYGLTEVNAAVAACTSNITNELGSVGIPFPKTNISIFEPETERELGYGEIGEICITGPNTMKEYYNNSKETENILKIHKDGKLWVHSGDLGYITSNGNLYIIDRIKRMIIRHDGFKIFPTMIEDVIKKLSFVKDCKVVGVKDIDYSQGKLPVAHIILHEGISWNDNIKNELYRVCEKELPEYCQLKDIVFDDEFPLTPIGKVDFKKMEMLDEEKIKKLILK